MSAGIHAIAGQLASWFRRVALYTKNSTQKAEIAASAKRAS
jgi:hypothetical protein